MTRKTRVGLCASSHRRIRLILGGVVVLAACVVLRFAWGPGQASADPSARSGGRGQSARPAAQRAAAAQRSAGDSKPAAPSASTPDVVAEVNGRPISRKQLGRECLMQFGEVVLESMVNKQLIAEECRRRDIVVSQADVKAEIERMAERFNLPVDQWMKLLERERGIGPAEYANDIVWPMLALRALAGERLQIAPDELRRAYETQYGEAVQARLIAVSSRQRAEQLRAEALSEPDRFGRLAKDHSEDLPSAASMGMIQPIRKHGSFQEVEQAAFTMEPGDISPVIQAGGQYLILKKEGTLPARPVKFEQVAPQLEELIRDGKLRRVSQEVFEKLQEQAEVVNVWNHPQLREQMPGVAAVVNGRRISIDALAEECITRHGREVLDRLISRALIEQACKKQQVTVTDADLDAEIAQAALRMLPPKADGSPDVEGWLESVTEEQGVSEAVYRRDSVWPSAALKKLVAGTAKVTEEDLQKGFEANYGPRVRVLAIVLGNFRRAQEVWEMARRNNTREYFGDLAEQYSTEAGSKALRGEVPPIRRHGGQPQLEKEAFALEEGELSGIIQVGEQFIILRCEGFTDPIDVELETVRDELHADILEKKQRLAMAQYFDRLQENATVINYLAGKTQAPTKRPRASRP